MHSPDTRPFTFPAAVSPFLTSPSALCTSFLACFAFFALLPRPTSASARRSRDTSAPGNRVEAHAPAFNDAPSDVRVSGNPTTVPAHAPAAEHTSTTVHAFPSSHAPAASIVHVAEQQSPA